MPHFPSKFWEVACSCFVHHLIPAQLTYGHTHGAHALVAQSRVPALLCLFATLGARGPTQNGTHLQWEQIRAQDGARLDSLTIVQPSHGSFLESGQAVMGSTGTAEQDL